MLDTKEIVDAFTGHLAARESWRLSDDQHLDLLRTVETIANLVAAAPPSGQPKQKNSSVTMPHG